MRPAPTRRRPKMRGREGGMCQFELCYKLKKTKRGSRREDVTEPKNKWTYGLFVRVLRIFLCLEVFAFVWDKNLYDATQVCYAVDTHCYCSSRLFCDARNLRPQRVMFSHSVSASKKYVEEKKTNFRLRVVIFRQVSHALLEPPVSRNNGSPPLQL